MFLTTNFGIYKWIDVGPLNLRHQAQQTRVQIGPLEKNKKGSPDRKSKQAAILTQITQSSFKNLNKELT